MMTDVLLFGALPYVATALLLAISILRYRLQPYGVSTLSSQFLESRELFWGSVPFHIGILTLLCGHLLGFAFPREMTVWNGSPLRLLIIEVTSLIAALLFLVGMGLLVIRRVTSRRLWPVTSRLDWAVYALLLFQVGSGLYIALFLRWGSAWYLHVAVPYLRSIFTLAPKVSLIASAPLGVRLHVLGAFALFSLFAFTRLMHVLVAPLPYLWRAPQVVLWNRDRKTIRTANGDGPSRGSR